MIEYLASPAIGTIADGIRFALLLGIAVGVVIGVLCFAVYQTWQDRREALALAARRTPFRALRK